MPSKTATIKIRQMLRDMNLMEERKRETATQRERGTRQRAYQQQQQHGYQVPTHNNSMHTASNIYC